MPRCTISVFVVLGLLVLPADATARSHHHHHHHARAHHAAVQREYWPILEEWLTPQEGREVEQAVTEELNEVADPEG